MKKSKVSAAAWVFLPVCYCTLLPIHLVFVCARRGVFQHVCKLMCMCVCVHTAIHAPDLCVSVIQTLRNTTCVLGVMIMKKKMHGHISALRPSSAQPVFSLLLLLLFLCEVEKSCGRCQLNYCGSHDWSATEAAGGRVQRHTSAKKSLHLHISWGDF